MGVIRLLWRREVLGAESHPQFQLSPDHGWNVHVVFHGVPKSSLSKLRKKRYQTQLSSEPKQTNCSGSKTREKVGEPPNRAT